VTVGSIAIVALAQVGPLFSSDAWNNVTFASGEIKNPQRNLPLALVIGSAAVIGLYILTNFAYLSVLPLAGTKSALTVVNRGIQHASEDRVATAMIEQVFSYPASGRRMESSLPGRACTMPWLEMGCSSKAPHLSILDTTRRRGRW
jgi:hypothetical protein